MIKAGMTMQANTPETAPEEEILEGVIVDSNDDTAYESVIVDDSSEPEPLWVADSSAPSASEESRRKLLEETLHAKADEINRGAAEATAYNSSNLEETTQNIARLKNLLRGIL